MVNPIKSGALAPSAESGHEATKSNSGRRWLWFSVVIIVTVTRLWGGLGYWVSCALVTLFAAWAFFRVTRGAFMLRWPIRKWRNGLCAAFLTAVVAYTLWAWQMKPCVTVVSLPPQHLLVVWFDDYPLVVSCNGEVPHSYTYHSKSLVEVHAEADPCESALGSATFSGEGFEIKYWTKLGAYVNGVWFSVARFQDPDNPRRRIPVHVRQALVAEKEETR